MQSSGANSNADEVGDLLEQLLNTFDLTRPGADQSLGEDLCAAAAQGISDQARQEQDPDQNAWPANQGRYGVKKRAKGLPVGVGLEADSSERMLSMLQIQGEVAIEPDRASMTYGKSPHPRDKAEWFTAGSNASLGIAPSGARNQPERPFYAMDATTENELVTLCEEHLARRIAELGI